MKIARKSRASLWIALLSAASMFAQEKPASPVNAGRGSTKQAAAAAQPATAASTQDPGERKFQANCSRCHNAPEQLSPRISGTVVRHMRVRALLSAEDERDILRYLAP